MATTANQDTVMRAFATLTAAAPNRADYQYVLDYFNTHGEAASFQALDKIFATHTDEQLAKMLLDTTYLNTIDLEGDCNTNNMDVATQYIRANAGNRVGAMLEISKQLSQITSGPLASIAKTYNEKIHAGYKHTVLLNSATALDYNFPKKIDGSMYNDPIYADNSGFQQSSIGGKTVATRAIWVFNTKNQNKPGGDSSQKLADLKGYIAQEVPTWGNELKISYRGLTSKTIALDDRTDYGLSVQEINQGIKHAINNDPVLSELLATEDGPNGTIKVIAKTDGKHGADVLKIDVRSVALSDLAILTPDVIKGYSSKVNSNLDPKLMQTFLKIAQINFDNAYNATQLGRSDNGTLVSGKNAETVHSHVVEGGKGNDLIVLSSSLAAANGDVVQFNSAFGHDTIVNFTAKGIIPDKFDFGLLHRTAYTITTGLNATEITNASGASVVGHVINGQIRLVQKHERFGITPTTIDNDSAEDVKQLFIDAQTGIETKQLYIAVNHDNSTGDVYQVVDGGGANDLNVTLLGHITLVNHAEAHTPFSWLTLSASNFA